MNYERSTGALWTVIAVALMMRLLGPIGHGLWYDEIWTLVDFGRLPLGQLLTTYGSDNNHPLYSVLAWLSLHAFGESAFALRLPALVFGVASVGVMFRFAFRVTPRREAWLATGLLMLSYHHVWFSQNARGYTMLLCLTLGATLYLERALTVGGRKYSLGMGLCLAFATYAHVSGVFVALSLLIATGVYFFTEREEGAGSRALDGVLGVVIGGAVSLALHASILTDMMAYFMPEGEGNTSVESEWTSPFWAIAAVAESLGFGLIPGLIVLASALTVLCVGGFSYLRERPWLLTAFVLPGVLGGGIMLVLGRNIWPRFFFFQAGFILLIVVRGLSVIATLLASRAPMGKEAKVDRALYGAAAAAAVLVFLVILPRAYTLPKQDFEGALAYVQEHRGPAPVMTVGLSQMPYARYFHTDFLAIDTVDALRSEAARSTAPALVLSTLPTFLESRHPELFNYLAEHAREVARFSGSVGDGDVVVLRLDSHDGAAAPQGEQP